MVAKTWLRFWVLAAIWGSSFLFMKLATAQFDPVTVTFSRLAGAAILFAGFLWLTQRSFPRDPKAALSLVVVGMFNTAVPFTLITWGNERIDTGLTTVLISTAPFFALTIAHFFLRDEKLNAGKILGLCVGFAGVVLLMQRAATAGETGTVPVVAGARAVAAGEGQALLGAAAVVGGAFCYGVCLTLIRRYLREVEPIRVAGYSVMIGTVAMVPIWLMLGQSLPAVSAWQPLPLISLALLAVLHTVVAYFLFYGLIAVWGPRASFVTYAMPPIGVALGAVVLGERLDWTLLLGGVLVLAGIYLAQTAHRRQERAAVAAVAAAAPTAPASSAPGEAASRD